jgi:hypothetical protein
LIFLGSAYHAVDWMRGIAGEAIGDTREVMKVVVEYVGCVCAGLVGRWGLCTCIK